MQHIDLSHIYHRPGELFWKENDPFQGAVPCFQPNPFGFNRPVARPMIWRDSED